MGVLGVISVRERARVRAIVRVRVLCVVVLRRSSCVCVCDHGRFHSYGWFRQSDRFRRIVIRT